MPILPTAKDPQTAAERAEENAQHYQEVLRDLVDMSADFARMVYLQAKARMEAAKPDSEPAPDLTIPFDRMARTVRRCIAAAQKLAEPAPTQAQPTQHRTAARKRIIREVEDVIQRTTGDTEAESLQAELQERLDDPDLDDEIDNRPVAEIIADICRDLGIAAYPGTHPWKRRTPADIAELCARAAARTPAPAAKATPPGTDPPVALAEAGARLIDGKARFRGG